MAVYRNENRWDRSNVVFRDGEIKLYDKERHSADMTYIDLGLSVMTGAALFEGAAPFGDFAALLTSLCARGQLAGIEVAERFYEIGSHQGIADMESHLRDARASS
jgi:hypothetical protein